jgi:hypothetical protein
MTQEDIELVWLFKGEKPGPFDLIGYFSELVQELFGSSFNFIAYSVKVKNHFKGKDLKFKEANIEKFKNDLPIVPAEGFELTTLLPGWEYKSRDKRFSVSTGRDFDNRGDRILSFSLNKASFLATYPRDKIVEIYLRIARYIKDNGGELVYGFVLSMYSEKFPGFFIRGVGNSSMSAKEEELLDAWNDGKDRCDSKIWTVFWGNLVTSRHFKHPEDVSRLRKAVGESDFFEIDGSTFFFHLPGESMLLGNEDKRLRREALALFDPLKRS